ncbi:cation-translocating P-type ATPase [Kribbella sp. NBC_00889]|uniref:cation-translocating P-type ATPase n=1 Tax=Kribbella sp. NBC_00889 TaxID=2975974 RepID=UPI0038655B03|nr:cation-transporting P-type ATPase [Kribbella sp. NBC_00889]
MSVQLTAPHGLTDVGAAQQLAEHGPNSIASPKPPSPVFRVLAQLRDPMILLLLGAAVLTAALHDLTDLAVILIVIVLNTTVGVVQELRAERALAALNRLAAPQATVLRSGRTTVIAAADVVPGDLVLLEAGDIVPADLELSGAVRPQTDESALTGESVPVEKDSGNEVFSGTVVTRGRGSGVVTRTGPDSALGRIAGLISSQRPRPTPLQVRLRSLSRILSIVALGLSGVVAAAGLLRGLPAADMIVTAVSLTVAAVPESLPAVVTLALAIGAHRMAKRSAVVRQLPAVETLGSVTVVAADKTGTLTEGVMLAERTWTEGGEFIASGNGYSPVGGLVPLGDAEPPTTLLRDIVLCNDADLRPPGPDQPDWLPLGDPTEAALLTLAHRGATDPAPLRATYPRIGEMPFDSVRKRMTTFHRMPGVDGELAVGKGAPEVMLDPAVTPYGDIDTARAVAAELSADGYRVLAVTDRMLPPGTSRTEDGMRLVGLVALTDPVRHNAPEVITSFRQAGVDLLLITGDAPGTAQAVAERVGLHTDAVVTGSDIDGGADPASGRVFARIRPEQKLDIVQAWQQQGHVVAMTGDGVNDAPALRRADIGVAMGKDGTEVARQAADLILTDDDLGTVVAAIEEGRRIYSNVRTFLRYALSGGLAEVLVMLIGPLLGLAAPLLPAQILWINMLTHGLPGVAIGAEPADPQAMRRGPRSPDEQVLGAGLWQRVAWTGALITAVTLAAALWARSIGAPWQTMAYIVLGVAQLGVAIALRRPRPDGERRLRFLDVAVLGALVAQVGPLFVPPLRDLLSLQALSVSELAVAVGFAILPGLVVAVRRVRKTRRQP